MPNKSLDVILKLLLRAQAGCSPTDPACFRKPKEGKLGLEMSPGRKAERYAMTALLCFVDSLFSPLSFVNSGNHKIHFWQRSALIQSSVAKEIMTRCAGGWDGWVGNPEDRIEEPDVAPGEDG